MKKTQYAFSIAAIYTVVGVLYIQFSSALVGWVATDVKQAVTLETIKGFGFIFVTAAGLFFLAKNLIGRAIMASEEAVVAREAFVRSQERATSGIFAASLAHDLKNLLLIIRFGFDEMQSPDIEPNDTTLKDVRDALESASELSDRLARAGEPVELTAESVDVSGVVGEVVDLLRLHRKARSVHIRVDTVPATATVYVALVRQAVTNLILNAVDAVPERGEVLVRTEMKDSKIRIEVHDNGEGVADAERVFEEFWTTKEHGTGLGLASVNICAAAHKGQVTIHRSSVLGGALFRLELITPSDAPLGLLS